VRLLVLLVVVSTPAVADEFDKLYSEGVELRRRHQDAEALDRFQRAHALKATPRTQAQIGFAEQALGRWVDAERDLKAALATADAWIEKNKTAIGRALATTDEHLGTLLIEGRPEGAEVRVGGAVAGTLPLRDPLRVPAGTITVELRAEGHAPGLRTIPIEAMKSHRERIELVPIAAAPPAPPVAVVERKPHDRKLWLSGWALVGVGAGMLVLGVAGVGVRESAADRWNSPACTGGGMTRIENCSGTLDTVHLGENLTISGFVAGGVLAVSGIVLLAVDAGRRGR
jgi:hypothetical protein